tara:strand:+ start:237 stop:644 length:408 start_codon:yes stop_codon:yes gene_type:complete
MPDINTLKTGDSLPERRFEPDTIQLFLYNAILWNAHKIHFDLPYAVDVEGYPGLVMAGPLMGDWLTQTAIEWAGEEGQLLSIEYSNRQASYIGDVLTSGGTIKSINTSDGTIELDIFVKNQLGDVLTPGVAIVRI